MRDVIEAISAGSVETGSIRRTDVRRASLAQAAVFSQTDRRI